MTDAPLDVDTPPRNGKKTALSYERIEAMPAALRECVHEFGEPIVQACLQAGVREPRKIRQLVLEIWEGARQLSQRRSTAGTLDWVLQQAGANISAKTLVRILRQNMLFIVPEKPTTQMVEASMRTVSNFDLACTKRQKHYKRLEAAIRAGVEHIWPGLI